MLAHSTSVSWGAGTRTGGGPGEVCEGEEGVRDDDPGLSCRLGMRTCEKMLKFIQLPENWMVLLFRVILHLSLNNQRNNIVFQMKASIDSI